MFLYNVCHYLCIMLGFWTVLAGGFGRIRTIEPQNSLSSGSDVNYFTYTAKNGRARKISFGRSEILRKNKRSVSPKSTFDVEMWQKGYNKFDNVRNTAPNGRTSLKKMIEEFPCPERLCEDDNRENEVVTFSTVNENISTSSDNSSTATTYGLLFSASLPEIIAICISSGTASLITVAGNVLVIASFAINKSLRIVNNYLILSLAAADLLIGTISMNLFTISIVHGEWRLGAAVCDFWLTLDYVASNASVMNLFIICLDRYFSVTKPVKYRNARTKKRFLMAIAGAWIISFVLWAPWIAGWQYIVGSRSVPENQCYIQFLKENKAVTVITAIGAFYLPAGAMCVLYWQVYQGIKNSRKKILGMNKTPNDDSTKSVSDDEHGDHITKSTRKNNFERWRILNCCANEKKKRTKKGIKEKRHIFTLATKCLGGILCCFKGNKKEAISPSVRERKNVDASNQAFIKGDCADKSPEREYEYRSKPTQSFLEINRKNDNFVSREIHPQETPKQEPFHIPRKAFLY
uniref:muscarinic acetylcholine receptor M3-like n=1 Tax=Styela clava TaxID=7725 RepID=UPI001939B36E|nr:muscarinic acetylcholine receptor M3-like [Styela clava]